MTEDYGLPRIEVDFDDYHIEGFRTGSGWCISTYPHDGRLRRNFLVVGDEINTAIVHEMEKGPPVVRADSHGCHFFPGEREAVLEAIERWPEFVIPDGWG